MQFRNITLQEQFFPRSMQEKILKANRAQPILNNIVDAGTTSRLEQELTPSAEKRLLLHIKQYWPAYLVALFAGYAIWRELNKVDEEER
ncbi:hypothetical protein [Phnomibacter ginsenosidimutans]|uniref:Uncharacterized protein n=1 Tax=Phnomibacter ginsenosidimutans TaxID=2676868 RepID=A0A6I6GBH0_9BACT|nr:hypothetical protein [Phnomibacter ginsenosidimutans]QGW27500.1 hypothetical protein GLV81_04775 [Phnomibacter ginsenosidimutans]